jgi:hypothetical protein
VLVVVVCVVMLGDPVDALLDVASDCGGSLVDATEAEANLTGCGGSLVDTTAGDLAGNRGKFASASWKLLMLTSSRLWLDTTATRKH